MLILFCCGHGTNSTNITPVITALVTATLSIIVTYFVTSFNQKENRKKQLADQLDSILKIGVQYPYLEMEDFAAQWDPSKLRGSGEETERYQRYSIYIVLVFNYMSELALFHNYNSGNILKDVEIKGWAQLHEKIWRNPGTPGENEAYDPKFVNLIEQLLKS